ncbi:kelch repeat-containing protein [Conexibacter stalactiti]|uniref:Kelch repeat-containing protein n=1 Tax=Conexibacter stalactiti TaxID=1940611 RepID=A0ABU4HYK3_9ACTN|nr:kelch repeat-containing protein [Conexibacter stalactiti]MDW5598290.1 kelch repeat-containing protein [Conexibacter stalactiti]MEC5038932.1 kelch repeat-containing protein [Conexibacter stalactiti]
MQKPRAALIPFVVVLAALLLADAPATAAGGSGWTPSGVMDESRSGAAVAQLTDGDVLAAGGRGMVNFLVSAERYDAASGAWSTVAAPLALRADGTATTLRDGRVLVTGGSNGGPLASAELYDPATDSWTPAAPLNEPRSNHTATLLADGSVLVAGGRWLTSAERYDPASDSWTTVGAMPSPHADHTATLLADGTVVVVGGTDMIDAPFGRPTAAVTRFDPANGAWTALPPLPQPRMRHATVALPDGDLLVVGGSDSAGTTQANVRLDPDDGDWRTVGDRASFPAPSALPLSSGLVLIVQGAEASVLDPLTGDVAAAGGPRVSWSQPSLVPLPGGDVLAFGGTRFVTDFGTDRYTPRIDPLTAPVDFGEQTTGRGGPSIPIPIAADGGLPLFVRALTIEGPHAGDFQLVSDLCSGDVLERRQSCFAAIRFTPRGDGLRSASLVVTAPGLPGERLLVPLSGSGVPAPPLPGPPSPPPANPAPPAARPVARRAAVEPKLRCSARKGRRVICTGLPRTWGSGKVRLSRAGIVHATGTLKHGKLTLTVRRRLFDRRYTLVVGKRTPVKVVID